jgi:hypothetical protein
MKNLFIGVALIASVSITAQDTKSLPEKEFSIFVGPSLTNIKNDNLSSDPYASSKGTVWFNGGINYCSYFHKNVGILLGLEYSRYKNVTAYQGAYRSETKSVDRDGYIYYSVSEANYKDTRTVTTVDVPLGFRLQVPISDKAQFFVDLGIRMNFVGGAKIEQKGNLDKKGAYPYTNFDNLYLYVEEDSYYGYANYNYDSKIDIPVNRVNLSYFFGAGVKAKLTEKSYLIINPTFMKGINDFTSKNSRPEYTNIFGEKSPYKKFILTQFALRVGIGFEL